MQVALIAPTEMLCEFGRRSKYHLILASEVLEDRKYAQFYRMCREQGDFVMLDNCAYELGESLSAIALAKCIELTNPTAMFLPDVRFKKDKTLARTAETLPKFREQFPHMKFFAVPQGNDLQSVVECYWELVKLGVDGFGIYEEIGEVTRLGRRADFLDYMYSQGMVLPNMTYHCLGMEEDVEQIKRLAMFPWVMGVDSAKPIVYGIHGVALAHDGPKVPYPHRPRSYFQWKDFQFRDVIHHNISMVQSWVSDPFAKTW